MAAMCPPVNSFIDRSRRVMRSRCGQAASVLAIGIVSAIRVREVNSSIPPGLSKSWMLSGG